MECNYCCFRTSDYVKVLELFESWRENGWNLPNFFIKVTHGPGGFHVFYDARLDNPAR